MVDVRSQYLGLPWREAGRRSQRAGESERDPKAAYRVDIVTLIIIIIIILAERRPLAGPTKTKGMGRRHFVRRAAAGVAAGLLGC